LRSSPAELAVSIPKAALSPRSSRISKPASSSLAKLLH
jgi:hypothetical protein